MMDKVKQIIGEIDPDKRQCMLCAEFKTIDQFFPRGESPLEERICFACEKKWRKKLDEEEARR